MNIPNEPPDRDVDLANVIDGVLHELGAENGPVFMSAVGQRLALRLEKPLRAVLGTQRLKNVIEKHLPGKVFFDGQGAQLSITFISPYPKKAPRLDPAFWAAFSKKIGEGKRRYISLTPPFDFFETEEELRDADKKEIPIDLIPDPTIPKSERDNLIFEAVKSWCDSNSLDIKTFYFADKRSAVPQQPYIAPLAPTTPIPAVHSHGAEALIKMIEAIPADDRSKYSLTLDLVYRLITAR